MRTPDGAEPALAFAPASARAGLTALLALDQRLGAIPRSTREPMVGQMRLTWWHAALTALDEAPPPAEPVLAALAQEVVTRGIAGARLAEMVDGWELLWDLAALRQGEMLDVYAGKRGGVLFAAAGVLLGRSTKQERLAGEGWALADLAANVSDPTVADLARRASRDRLDRAFARRWPRSTRPLAILALLASDRAGGPVARWRRALRVIRLHWTGRRSSR